MEFALNGTWFGASGQLPDAPLNTVFRITVDMTGLEPRTFEFTAGRYTPCELAAVIQRGFHSGLDITGLGDPVGIDVSPVFDTTGVVYKGMRFRLNTSLSKLDVPFAIDFSELSSSAHSINPQRLGYQHILYSGRKDYMPGDESPFYPIIVQGSQQQVFRSLQRYDVFYLEETQTMRVVTLPFTSRFAQIEDYDPLSRVVRLRLNIAHGLPQGQHIYVAIVNGGVTNIISCVTLPNVDTVNCSAITENGKPVTVPEPLRGSADPKILFCYYGGTNSDPFGGTNTVLVEFTNPNNWTLDASYGVKDCIHREIVGANPIFYSFTGNTSAFTTPGATNNRGFYFSKETSFNLPNSVELNPFKYVLVKVTVNDGQGDGNTAAIETELNAGEIASKGFDTFLARVLIGDNINYNQRSRVFDIQHIAINKLNKVRVQIFNPDGTYYNFHGRSTSVGLVFNLVKPRL